jgi:ribosomal biogenesis protein LAS1
MRLVPWASWTEWAAVGGALLGGCAAGGEGVDEASSEAAASAAATAAERVAAWRARGRVPLAVEITAALAEARAQDGAFSNRPGKHERRSARPNDMRKRRLRSARLV